MGLLHEDVFRHMKRAYSARSKLVHGGTVTDVEVADGTRVPLADFARITAEHLRTALRKAISLASESPDANRLVDWDSLILAGAQFP